MIIIWSNSYDSTADLVQERIKELGGHPIRINIDKYGEEARIKFQNDPDLFALEHFGANIFEKDISAVYYRRPSLSEIPRSERDFSSHETWYFFRAFFLSLREVTWMNHPRDLLISENKLLQLQLAKNFGLTVPSTIVPTNKVDAFEFFCKHNRTCVCKPGYAGMVKKTKESGKVVYTWSIPKHYKINDFESVIKCPTIIQELIEKTADIRVTVSGREMVAIKIKPRKEKLVDWRASIGNDLDYVEVKIEDEIRQKILRLMRKLNLSFAALDFGLSLRGEWIFFELNPSGQWEWLELATEVPLSKKIAKALLGRCGG